MFKEWPLVAFTIAGQMAVGIILLAFPLFLAAGPDTAAAARELRLVVLAFVFGLMVLATTLSFFHLHHPFRAYRVLANFRTSRLSREIFFELGFMALVALTIVLVGRGLSMGHLLWGIYAAGSVAGILFLLSMIGLYMLETLPFWNRAYTPLSFVLTSLSLGAMAVALLIDALVGGRTYFRDLLTVSFFLVAAEIVFSLFFAAGHGVFGPRPGPSLRPPAETPRFLHLGRLALSTAGLVLIRVAIMTRDVRGGTGSGVSGLLAVAFVLVLASEVAGRFLFYGLLARPGR
jgi:DMSO reductase anchor subunit